MYIHKCIRNDIRSMKRRAFNKHSSLSEETLIIKTKFSIDFENDNRDCTTTDERNEEN